MVRYYVRSMSVIFRFAWRGGEYTGTEELYQCTVSLPESWGADGNEFRGGGGKLSLSKICFCWSSILAFFCDFAMTVSGVLFLSYLYVSQSFPGVIGYIRFGESINVICRICILANQGKLFLQHLPQQQQQQHHKQPVVIKRMIIMEITAAQTSISIGVLHKCISLQDLLDSLVHPKNGASVEQK